MTVGTGKKAFTDATDRVLIRHLDYSERAGW